MTITLRPYQAEVARSVMDSVAGGRGLTFSVEISRQGGKNELSAHLEVLLLTMYLGAGGNLVKASPTFKPQTVVSMLRLCQRLDDYGFAGIFHRELGYIIRLGEARAVFLSADETANVVGNTAHLLLEVDESQDVAREKYTKDFKPMCASTNATIVHYGTTWDDATLLEETRQTCLELERRDGVRRVFRYDWQEVAIHNPAYGAYVESERARLGEDHPLFRTQYRLLPILGGGGLFSAAQRAQLQGDHARQRAPSPGRSYVIGIDLAGEAEQDIVWAPTRREPPLPGAAGGRDSTVLTIAEVERPADELRQPIARVVEHRWWTGQPHQQAYQALLDVIRAWRPALVLVDATGLGEPIAAFLRQAAGPRVHPFKFTQASKSELGFELLAAVNRGGLKLYQGDGSPEYRELHAELDLARAQYRPNQTMTFGVDPARGHDDFLTSLALAAYAAHVARPATAKGGTRG
ncbi:MAG: hypothetical protein HY688_04595 [Chloroflexi bacterium]|nr:hypothetical protein [Chloroflexota bacterium]